MSNFNYLEEKTRQALNTDPVFQEVTRSIMGSILDAGTLEAYTEYYTKNEGCSIDINDPEVLNPMTALDEAIAAKHSANEAVEKAINITRIAILSLINIEETES